MLNVTIGIPANNEERNIGKLLEILCKEKFSFDLSKIIVVASGCTDRTEDIVKRFVKRNNKIKLISEKVRRGKASAVNLILREAKSDIIVFVCADNLPKVGSINKLVKKFSNKEVGAAFGRPVPLESKGNLFGYLSHLIWKLHHFHCLENPKISGELCAVRNGIIPMLPNNIINDDGYFTAIMRKKRKEIIYVPAAVTYMTGRNGFFAYIKRRRRIARGFMQLTENNLNVSIPLRNTFRLVIKEIHKDPKNSPRIFFAMGLEIIINLLAYYDSFRGYNPYCWDRET